MNQILVRSLIPLFLLVSWTAHAQIKALNGTSIDIPTLDKYLKHQMDSLHIPGLSVAIVNDGKIVFQRALGLANIETKTPVDDKTVFEACSLTKPLFAYFAMRMIDKGVIALDTPLYKYLPNYDLDYDNRYKLITARMVLDHSTGLPNWRTNNRGLELDIKFTPGSQFSYSGEAYEYLANVIAHRQNLTLGNLETLFQREIAEPVGMTNAHFTWNSYLEAHKAMGYWHTGKDTLGWGKPRPVWKQIIFSAAGGAQTEAVSYSKFLIAFMDGKLLKKSSIEEMLKEQIHVSDTSRTYTGRGLGLAIETPPEGIRYMHGGSNGDFNSYFVMDPKKKWAYVYFTNCDRGYEFNETFKVLMVKGKFPK